MQFNLFEWCFFRREKYDEILHLLINEHLLLSIESIQFSASWYYVNVKNDKWWKWMNIYLFIIAL